MASGVAVNSGVAVQPNTRAIVPALTQRKFITSQSIQRQITFDLFKSGLSNEYLKKLYIRVVGAVDTEHATPGAETKNLNPYDLLGTCVFNLSPTPGSGLVPINQLTGRGLYVKKAINDRNFAAQNAALTLGAPGLGSPDSLSPAIIDATGSVDYEFGYELNFQPNHVRKPVQYGIPLSKFTSAVVNLSFTLDQTLFVTGSSNTWDFSGLIVELWGDWDYDTAPNGVHATEIYEQSFPITSNGQMLINQLPAGVIYTDFTFITEYDGLPVDGIINNIDIEGGGRNWTFAGETNINFIKMLTREQFDGSAWAGQGDATLAGYGDGVSMTGAASMTNGLAGIYGFPLRGGSFYRGFDARNTQLLIKPNVTGWIAGHTFNFRLIAGKINPYGIVPMNPQGGAGSTTVRGKR